MITDYDPIAEQYGRSKYQPWRIYIETFTLMNLIGDPMGKAVVDLACGEGFYSRMIRKRGAAGVLGVDLSEGMIRVARDQEIRQGMGIEYNNYLLDVSIHEAAFRSSGFRDVRWHQPMLSPDAIAAHGMDYWRCFMDTPPIVAIECLK